MITFPRVEGIASITALAIGPDGALYFARPATRQIVRLAPDSNGFIAAAVPPDHAQVFADNLPEAPNGLTYFDGSWYVSADTTITRLRDSNGDGTISSDEQQVIVDHLPGGAGDWLGNIHVGPDKRLYVAKGASCDACLESDPRRAALLSFALDGSDPQIVARGLHDSEDFSWLVDGSLALLDNERAALPAELNRIAHVDAVQPVDFGWPRCDATARPVTGVEGATVASCAGTLPAEVTFDAGSHPSGVALYSGSAFPDYRNNLLVTLAGSWNAKMTVGYALMRVPIQADGHFGTPVQVVPEPSDNYPTIADASLYLISFYPDHPAGIAIDSAGWIYVSVSEGRIYRFRPV